MDYKFINNNSDILIIIFNSNDYNNSKFEFENYFNNFFLNRTKPNLFLRDINCSWYYYGVKDFSISYDDTVKKINDLIINLNINKKVFIGSSSGGYASLYFGIKLNADYVIAFSPQIELLNSKILYYNKFKEFKNFDKNKQNSFDLSKLIKNSINKIYIYLVKYSNFYNISNKENKYIYQNLNDEKSYSLIKDNNNIEHYFIENGNHCDIALITIKLGLLDTLLINILYN